MTSEPIVTGYMHLREISQAALERMFDMQYNFLLDKKAVYFYNRHADYLYILMELSWIH